MTSGRLPNETPAEYRKRHAREHAAAKREAQRAAIAAGNNGVYKRKARGKAIRPPIDAGVSDEEWYALRQQPGETTEEWEKRNLAARKKRWYNRNQESILSEKRQRTAQRRAELGPPKKPVQTSPHKDGVLTYEQWLELRPQPDEIHEEWNHRYHRELKKIHYALDPEKFRKPAREAYAENPEKGRERSRRHYQENPEYYKEYGKTYYLENKEQRRANLKAWAEANPERYAELRQEWYNKNQARRNAYSSAYRAQLGRATPSWMTYEEIEPTYREAITTTLETGVMHHVDHIVPLKGKTKEGYRVSGLHVSWNLRVLTGTENVRKRNNFTNDEDALDWSASGYR